ncbi:actin-like ATPase domain-containing protein, partial [Mrakia frigida]|uniref:Hsp70 family protein n=1 Tax=Mrakia frigida TaxID=29902 RepID=UPI003FCC0376
MAGGGGGGTMGSGSAGAVGGAAGEREGRLSVSIDLGTTFSGVAYGSSRIASGQVQQILHWPGSSETFRKIPTALVYSAPTSSSPQPEVIAWGLEAKSMGIVVDGGLIKCEWFKLYLEPSALRDGMAAVDPRLPPLPPGKSPQDVIVDFLTCLWDYAKEEITREVGLVGDLDTADVWITVPAAWDARGCDLMREAAIRAGLVHRAGPRDLDWRERLRIITEPEAAAVHCAALTQLHKLRISQTFLIFDGGGGTCDLATYRLIGALSSLEIAEVCARSGANCGSLFLDLRFRELVKSLLRNHPVHLDPPSLANYLHSFSETDKINFRGREDDNTFFLFPTFNSEDADDPAVGLINGELAIKGSVLRREVFDPVISEVLDLIQGQVDRNGTKGVDALLLVGGFSGSEYLFHRIEEQFGSSIKVIARPADCDVATVQGAARYGLARRPLVSSVIAPKGYLMRVKLPAETEDYNMRPAYITENKAGMPVCENRLQYLCHKGAILRKGQRIKTRFCKFSTDPSDKIFVAVLYTTDSSRTMRYSDEGDTEELCRWTVDLSGLPSFQENMHRGSFGFYTEFDLGLELDSAEVRGVLLVGDEEWGRVTFDFLQ